MDGAPTPGPPAGVAPPPEAGPDPAPAPAPAAPSAPAPEGGASGPADGDATRRQRGGGGAGGASSRPGPRPLLEDTVPLVVAPAGPVPEDVAAKAGKPRRVKRRTQEQKLEQEKGLIELGFRLLEPSLEPEAAGTEAAASAAAALGGFLQQRWGKAGEYERLAAEKRKQQEERERAAAEKRRQREERERAAAEKRRQREQREQEQRERAAAEKRRLQELREQKQAQKQAEEEGGRGTARGLVAGGASPLVGLQDELRKQLGTAPALAPGPAPRPGALVLDKFAVPVGGLALRPPPRGPVPPGTAPVVDHAELLRKLKQRIAASTAARPQARAPRPAWDDDRDDDDDDAGTGVRAAGPAKAATQQPASESTHSLYSQMTVDDRWDREEGNGLAYLEAAAVFALQPGLDFGGGGFVKGMTAANFDAAAEWDAIEASLFPRADHGRKTRRPRHRGDRRKAAPPGAQPRRKKQPKEQPAAVTVASAAGEDGKKGQAKRKRAAAEAGVEAPYKKTYTSSAAQRRVPGAAVPATGQLAPCPFKAKNVEVLAWGRIVPGVSGPNLQSRQRHVWPVGFKSRRAYTDLATGNPEVRTQYVSETLQGGDGELLFRVTAVDGTVFEGATATAPWQQVLKAVNNKNQGRSKVTVSGPQFFGLAIEPIFLQIRQLPGYAEVAGGLM